MSLYASEFNKLANAGQRPATPQSQVSIERKRSELFGTLNLNQWGTTDDQTASPGSPVKTRHVSNVKLDELKGTGVLKTDVVYQDSLVSHNQRQDPERNFHVDPPPHWGAGQIIHVRESRPSSREKEGGDRIVRKGHGDRSSHIDCLPLGNQSPTQSRAHPGSPSGSRSHPSSPSLKHDTTPTLPPVFGAVGAGSP